MMLGTFLNKYLEKKKRITRIESFLHVFSNVQMQQFSVFFFFFQVDLADCKSPDKTSNEIPGKER